MIVNTGGFSRDVMEGRAKLCEEAAEKMKGIGLGEVCYGDVLITNRLTSRAAVAAFYVSSKDEMFVRADADAGWDTVRYICHELAHRFEHKFAKNRIGIQTLYNTIRVHTKATPKPKPGDQVEHEGRTWTVDGVSNRGVLMTTSDGKGGLWSHPAYKNLVAPDRYHFVTDYAAKDPSENFAEMVSFYAMGKLPAPQVALLKPLLA